MKKITVLIVEDHTIVRQELRALLSREHDIEVIGEADNGRDGVDLAKELRPDIVLMDIAMPLLNGLEATRQITEDVPAVKVVILSSYSDEQLLLHALGAGASGYIIKQTTVEDVIRAIREVHAGNAHFSPTVMRRLRDYYQECFSGRELALRRSRLSSGENKVLQLIAEGCTNNQIADRLRIPIEEVISTRNSIMNKLDIYNIAGLTRFVVERRVIESRGKVL